MNGVDFLALVLARILEGEAGDAGGGLLGDDLEALDHARHHFMLDARVQALGVFAHDDQVDIRIAGRDMRQVADGAEIRVQLKALAQLHVDAGKAAADGRGHRTFQSHAGALD